MKSLEVDWSRYNWRWILFISLLLIVVPSVIYHFATMDAELKNYELRIRLEERLEKEMKEIKLPPKTAVNKFHSLGKRFSIFIGTRYRTEMGQQEFIRHFTEQLEKTGWIYYGSKDFGEYVFCRGKFDAVLNYEGNGGSFNDNGDYYQLSFHTGLRPLIDFNNSRPENCK